MITINYFIVKKTIVALCVILAVVIAIAMTPQKKQENIYSFHSPEQLAILQKQVSANALQPGEYFMAPFTCQGCHGADSLHLANIDANGVDINLFDDWQTSMMGLAGIDPFWRAKVSQEIITNPAHTNELQTFCTSCHAPSGHYSAMFHGQSFYTIAQLDTEELGRTGVGCAGCHTITNDSITGLEFSGRLHYDTTAVEYGPFINPMTGPMQLYVGLTPTYSEHMGRSQVCASCHTLISNVADLSGNLTGNTFVEQATYHEWLNSSFPAQNKFCQTCHMPAVDDQVKIANGILNLQGRSPFNLHQFAGANSFMVDLIKDNKDTLGVVAPDANFDSTLSAINTMLTKNSLGIKIHTDTIDMDSAYFDVTLTNKAGHKFPTGYPSRRAVLTFIVTKENGDTLFASGLFDSGHEVVNLDSPFEMHRDVISNPADVQVYEMVMGDVNGNKTTILERANSKLKDNRIPPAGFNTTHAAYDTAFIAGNALSDADFNKNAGSEGTGKDIVHYHVALNGYKGKINASASVFYQTIPPAWLQEMRTLTSTPIDRFLGMFDARDNSPILVTKDTLNNVLIPDGISIQTPSIDIVVSPNPSNTGKISLTGKDINLVTEIKVYSATAELCSVVYFNQKRGIIQLDLPAAKGYYFLLLKTPSGIHLKKVLKV